MEEVAVAVVVDDHSEAVECKEEEAKVEVAGDSLKAQNLSVIITENQST